MFAVNLSGTVTSQLHVIILFKNAYIKQYHHRILVIPVGIKKSLIIVNVYINANMY